MSTIEQSRATLRTTAAIVAGLAVLYLAIGGLGLQLAHVQRNTTLIWAPTGLSFAALLLYGIRVWPGVLLGATGVGLLVGTGPFTALAIGIGNTLEAVAAAWLLQRVAGFDPGFARLRDVLSYMVLGALLSTALGASIGVASLVAGGEIQGADVLQVWPIWWLGSAGGAIVVGPLILVGVRGSPTWRELARRPELWVTTPLLVGCLSIAFSGVLAEPWIRLVVAFAAFPYLVVAGLRLGPRGAVVGSSITALAAVLGTARGVGPFGAADAEAGLLLLWAYATTMGVGSMVLAAAVAERESVERARGRAKLRAAELEHQVQHYQRLESLGVLAGGIAHDFNNVLAVIRGNAELALSELVLERPIEDELTEIQLAVDRAAELCDQLLSYAGRKPPVREEVELRELVGEMTSLLRTSISEHIEVETHFESGVPTVFADSAQLGQVVMNLILNAAEAIGDAGGHIRLVTGVGRFDSDYMAETYLLFDAPAGDYAYLEVSDDGGGMDEETLERLFEPFFTTRFEGRGLGMAVVLGIVQAHRAALRVASELGQGSVFRLLLPLFERRSSLPAGHDISLATPEVRGVVLIADDDRAIRSVVSRELVRAGWSVLVAADGQEALDRFENHGDEVDAVILDIVMPRRSGLEALRAMRERCPDLPAILMSGYGGSEVQIGSFKCLFLRKPFSLADLRDHLGRLRIQARPPLG